MDEPAGQQLRRVRESRKSREGETRYPGGQLSRDVLAGRTGGAGYVTVSLDTIKSAEKSATSGVRIPDDDTLASLYVALDARPDEFPAGALAQARYLVTRWLDESRVGVEIALSRRQQIVQLLAAEEAADQPLPSPRHAPGEDVPRTDQRGQGS